METKKALVIVGSVLVIGLFVFAWWRTARTVFFAESRPVVTAPAPLPPVTPPASDAVPSTEVVPESQSVAETAPVEQPKTFTGFTENDIRKGQVTWQETPEDMGDLGWTSKDVYAGTYDDKKTGAYSSGVHYVKVGTVTGGTYAGSDVIVVVSWLYAESYPHDNSPSLSHYLRRGDQMVYLANADVADGEKANTPDTVGEGTDTPVEPSPVEVKAPHETDDYDTRIEDLATYGKEFVGQNERETFIQDEYADRAFFSSERLKPVFVQPQLGQVWMTDPTSKQESRSEFNSYIGRNYTADGKAIKGKKLYYDPIALGGFYLERPDGILESYRLKLDVFDTFDRSGILQATWNDGTRNGTAYEEYPGGCGLSAYAYDKTGIVDPAKDLVAVGKTDTGDTVYEYTNLHPDLKQYFKDTYFPSLQSRSDKGPLPSEAPQATLGNKWYAEFLKMHPIVFWVDPLGRVLEFYNTETIPLAECGKPVIYLYPERTTDVSVRVFPSEGVSVSDPAYSDGWQVTAHPDGSLENAVDGKTYPYLFWEGGSDVLYRSPEQGFVVVRDGLEGFFDEKLAQLGLNARETADSRDT